jgi:hypothetical protein
MLLAIVPVSNLVSTSGLEAHMASLPLSPWHLVLPLAGACFLAGPLLELAHVGRVRRGAALAVAVMILARVGYSTWRDEKSSRVGFANPVLSGEFARPGYALKDSRMLETLLSLSSLKDGDPEQYIAVRDAFARAEAGAPFTAADVFSSCDYVRPERCRLGLDALVREGWPGFRSRAESEGPALLDRLVLAHRLKEDGIAAFVAGRRGEALRTLERSVRLDDEPLAMESLAAAYADAGRLRPAVRCYDRLLRLPGLDESLARRVRSSRADTLARLSSPSSS